MYRMSSVFVLKTDAQALVNATDDATKSAAFSKMIASASVENNIATKISVFLDDLKPELPIVIVGAGPIGLRLCIDLHEKGIKNIIIVEKRSEDTFHSRHQQMIIENVHFNKFPNEIKTKLLATPNACKIYRPPKLIKNYCFKPSFVDSTGTPPTNGYSIMTSTLQTIFFEYIKSKSGATFMFNKHVQHMGDNKITLASSEEILFKTLVLSSGKIITPNAYNINIVPNPTIGNLYGAAINIKFDETKGNILDVLDHEPLYNKLFTDAKIQHRFRFFRQQHNNLYVGINISAEEYKEYKAIFGDTTSNKIQIDKNSDLFKYIATIVSVYTGISEFIIKSLMSIEPGEFRIFSFELFTTSMAVYNKPNAHVYIIGDAVQNTHFFTGYGVNFGFQTAEKISAIIVNNKFSNAENIAYQTFINTQKSDIVNRVNAIKLDFSKTCTDAQIKELETSHPDIQLSKLPDKEKCYMLSHTPPPPPPPPPPGKYSPRRNTLKHPRQRVHAPKRTSLRSSRRTLATDRA